MKLEGDYGKDAAKFINPLAVVSIIPHEKGGSEITLSNGTNCRDSRAPEKFYEDWKTIFQALNRPPK
jgi:hypothetical protein